MMDLKAIYPSTIIYISCGKNKADFNTYRLRTRLRASEMESVDSGGGSGVDGVKDVCVSG